MTDISDTHYELLSALLSFDWFTRVPSEVASYTEFLKHLTFAKPHFFEQIYQSMVVHFRGPTKASSGTLPSPLKLCSIDKTESDSLEFGRIGSRHGEERAL